MVAASSTGALRTEITREMKNNANDKCLILGYLTKVEKIENETQYFKT